MAQAGNKNIDNASGQVVRLDIENTLKTVATHNFGPRNNAGTIEPCEFLADDTTNKLLIRKSSGGDQAKPTLANGNPNPNAATFFEVGDLDTANLGLLSKSGGTMTGVLQLPNGSESAPSLRFGDAGTGIFRGFSNTVSFTSDGSKIFHVDSNGININSSKELKWRDNDSSHFISFKAPSTISNNLALTLPTADGTSGQALITSGSGTLSFGTPTVGAANLTGNTLASGVTASSLTSVGTLTSLTSSGNITTSGIISGGDLLLSAEIYLGGGTGSANANKYLDAQVGTTENFHIRSVDGGDASHRNICLFSHDGTHGKVTADKFIGDGSNLTNINRPAFRATVTSEQDITTLTGITTGYSKEYEEVIEFNNEDFDTNSCYDPSTYRFTPNIAGYYHVNVQTYLKTTSGSEIVRMLLRVYKNTNTVVSSFENDTPDDTEFHSMSIATNGIVYMNGTSDYLYVKMLVRLESNRRAIVSPTTDVALNDSDGIAGNTFEAYRLNI